MKITSLEMFFKKVNKQNITIIGHMGSGKSIIGKDLSKYLNFAYKLWKDFQKYPILIKKITIMIKKDILSLQKSII